MAEYYTQRSSAGLLITEGTTISEEANGWNESPGIYTDEMTEGWKHTTNAVHEKGAVIFLQLWHTGRASHRSFHGGKPAVAPSAIKINEPDIHTPTGKQPLEVPRALETSEIPRIVEDYRRAAERAKEAGFDGVELHGANGYLIDTFLQSKTNDRTDEYGGSIEIRYRFLKEVIEGVISVWPAHRVGVHLSPNGSYNDMGSPDYREQFTFVAGQLDRFGLAYLHVVDGLAFGFHNLGAPMTMTEFRQGVHGFPGPRAAIGPRGKMTANLPTSLATIGGDDLAGDQPIDQHADGGQVLIDRRLLKILTERFDVGGDMQRLDVSLVTAE
jgi:2,4-dienoyl-CoA reductase-like NADH-dependent reductase (Old Yellow Enzyme family)